MNPTINKAKTLHAVVLLYTLLYSIWLLAASTFIENTILRLCGLKCFVKDSSDTSLKNGVPPLRLEKSWHRTSSDSSADRGRTRNKEKEEHVSTGKHVEAHREQILACFHWWQACYLVEAGWLCWSLYTDADEGDNDQVCLVKEREVPRLWPQGRRVPAGRIIWNREKLSQAPVITCRFLELIKCDCSIITTTKVQLNH